MQRTAFVCVWSADFGAQEPSEGLRDRWGLSRACCDRLSAGWEQISGQEWRNGWRTAESPLLGRESFVLVRTCVVENLGGAEAAEGADGG